MLELSQVTNFCGHEHWGSLAAFGMEPEGFRPDVVAGAEPNRCVTLADVVLDPYHNGHIHMSGYVPGTLVQDRLGEVDFFEAAQQQPAEVLQAVRPALNSQRLTGTYQCLRQGLLELYRFDLDSDDPTEIEAANKQIGANYRSVFEWYGRAKQQLHMTEVIRPVHPLFFYKQDSEESAELEAAVTGHIMRIDPFLEMVTPGNPHRASLVAATGVDPQDASSWRQFLDLIFERARERGTTGIKQLQAYSRTLDFTEQTDSAVYGTELPREAIPAFQDWVVHECCRRAHELGWPHQFHIGTHNLPDSSPLPLKDLATRYPRMKLVLLHCWPFLDEVAFLAKMHANIFIDTCWQPVLNPAFFKASLERWLGYVPRGKVMCSHDATSVEMAAGSAVLTRQLIAGALQDLRLNLTDQDREEIARELLETTAAKLYRG